MRRCAFSASGWCAVGLLALALALATPAPAATLRWKFKTGEDLHYVMDQKTITTVKVNNQEIKTTLSQTINMTWSVKDVHDGTADLTQTFDRVQTTIASAFGEFKYDSQAKEKPEGPIAAGIVPLLDALVGAQFSFKMSAQGELSDVKVPEKVAQALKAAGAPGGAAGGGPFSEEGLKHMITESSLNFPSGDLPMGKTWTRPTKADTPPLGTMTIDKTYTYEGPSDHVEKISLKTKISLEPAADAKINVQIKDQEGQGSFDFDADRGRMVNSHVTEKMDLLINIMNMDVTQNINTTTDMKLVPAGSGGEKPAFEVCPGLSFNDLS